MTAVVAALLPELRADRAARNGWHGGRLSCCKLLVALLVACASCCQLHALSVSLSCPAVPSSLRSVVRAAAGGASPCACGCGCGLQLRVLRARCGVFGAGWLGGSCGARVARGCGCAKCGSRGSDGGSLVDDGVLRLAVRAADAAAWCSPCSTCSTRSTCSVCVMGCRPSCGF